MSTEHLSTQDAARYCGVDRRTILRWIDGGLIESFQTGGGRNRIRRTDLIRFMRDRGMPVPHELDQGPRRVLIVDDDPNHIAAMLRLVKQAFPTAEIRQALDGFSAGLVVQSFMPHVMLLDVVMPGMDGLEVCRRIRSEPELDAVRIVVVTGILDDALEERFLKLGADRCFAKPVDPLALQATLRTFLERADERPRRTV